MKLIAGLGNPGPEYAKNRHNVGFMVVDELLRRWGSSTSSKFSGAFAKIVLHNTSAILLKPMTYMNRSGESVGACARYFDIDAADLLVIHDELDISFGEVRLKSGGGHAGHNGLRSMITHVGADFSRLRFGVGRPPGNTIEHVLSDFSSEEGTELDALVGKAADAAEHMVRFGAPAAMNQFNRKKKRLRNEATLPRAEALKPESTEEAE